jgi:hypothetical protein
MVSILASCDAILSGGWAYMFREWPSTFPPCQSFFFFFFFFFLVSMELGAGKFGSLIPGLLASDTIIAIADCVSR